MDLIDLRDIKRMFCGCARDPKAHESRSMFAALGKTIQKARIVA